MYDIEKFTFGQHEANIIQDSFMIFINNDNCNDTFIKF